MSGLAIAAGLFSPSSAHKQIIIVVVVVVMKLGLDGSLSRTVAPLRSESKERRPSCCPSSSPKLCKV